MMHSIRRAIDSAEVGGPCSFEQQSDFAELLGACLIVLCESHVGEPSSFSGKWRHFLE